MNIINNDITGENIAHLVKYFLQYRNSNIINKIDYKRIGSKCFYMKYQKLFNNSAIIFNKYKIDYQKYIKFVILDLNIVEKTLKKYFLNFNTINAYIQHLQKQEKLNNIYKWFTKSINNIVNDCIKYDFYSTKDYIRYLISSKKIANYYITGKISQYWLAGIPGFKKIIKKLDQLSQDEFSNLYQNFDIYNTEINQSLLMLKSCKVNPLKMTDIELFKRRNFK